jgi:hypothetical protein
MQFLIIEYIAFYLIILILIYVIAGKEFLNNERDKEIEENLAVVVEVEEGN